MAANTDPPAVLTSFDTFPAIPQEIRDQIWRTAARAIGGRLILIISSATDAFWLPVCKDKTENHPSILSACRNSRVEALKILKPLRCLFNLANGTNSLDIKGMFMNPETDTICLQANYLDGFIMSLSKEQCSDIKLLLTTELDTITYRDGSKSYERGGLTSLISRLRNLKSVSFVREGGCMRSCEWDIVHDYARVIRWESDIVEMDRLLTHVKGQWKKNWVEEIEEVEIVTREGMVYSLGRVKKVDSNFDQEVLFTEWDLGSGDSEDSNSGEEGEGEDGDKEAEAYADAREELLSICKLTRGMENIVLRWRGYGEEEQKNADLEWAGRVEMGSLVGRSGRSVYTSN